MTKRLPLLIIFICVFVTASTSVHANLKSVFVFGDSQFDPGNNQFVKNCTLQANFTPYGSTYFHHPTGRFTNGRTVVDFLAQFLAIKFQKPYQEVYRLLAKGHRKGIPPNGLNFASAGSGLLPYTNKNAAVTPIQVQLQQFQALITQKHVHKKQIKKSLFFIVSGANDVFSYFLLPNASNMAQKTYVRAMLKEVKHFTSKIYKYGGRRIVLFSIGVIGCVPGRVLMRGAPSNRCIDKMDSMARYYNAGLKRFVKNIHKMFPGTVGVYAAVYDTSKKYLDNPKLYGFANVTHACCGGGPLNGMLQCGLNGYTMCLDPSEYFFWDYFHPTERTYGLMMERSSHLIPFLGSIILIFASAKACVKSVFLFGDSQFDPGNNAYIKNCTIQANFPPYGSSFFPRPTGRFTDGRIVADFIAQFLETEFQKPFQELANGKWNGFPENGINFASGGSGILPYTNKGKGATTIKLQLQQFQALIDEKHVDQKQIENSLFFLESGSVDILDYFLLRNTSDPKAYVQAMLKEVNQFIDIIYKLGARRIVIFSVGPLGCIPFRINIQGASSSQCFDKIDKMSEEYNVGLQFLVNNISKTYPYAIGVYGAIYTIVQNLLKNPKIHGFANANDACCGGGTLNGRLQCGLQGYNLCSKRNDFFFWDYIHPSERVYELIARDLWAGSKDHIRPINLRTLACDTRLY
ncbi:hypothetical protein E3N88_37613 [Mikania micrantha]|uniref:SGNH hydrolase-type esterase domain-containing protein n=1 Tax=Mikania micrantha TaxID=192012 RepID=A0A5N6LRK8_9ASTR|nr:hypothetical protein E3N88_37613 [Mikania micrantha]